MKSTDVLAKIDSLTKQEEELLEQLKTLRKTSNSSRRISTDMLNVVFDMRIAKVRQELSSVRAHKQYLTKEVMKDE